MATGTLSPTATTLNRSAADLNWNATIWGVLKALGSLHITIWGFAFAILLLFVGTLAQDESTIVDVKRDYFISLMAKVPFDVFLPVTIFPMDHRVGEPINSVWSFVHLFLNEQGRVPGALYIPGGQLIGLVLLVNLIAAKLTRFHLVAKGPKLVAGLAFCLVGLTITAVVILGAHAEDGLQGEPPFSYSTLWDLCRWSVWGSTLGLIAYCVFHKFETTLSRSVAILTGVLLAIWSLWIAFFPDQARIPDPGLRIIWQMSKSLIAGGILLVGLSFLFGRRGGNVLIHLSIGLLMLGQFIFGDRQIEEQIVLSDGETTNMAIRPDEVELVLIDPSNDQLDRVIAVSEKALRNSASRKQRIVDDALPFEIAVKDFYENSDIVSVKDSPAGHKNLATTGLGTQAMALNREKIGGAKEGQNLPSAYVELFKPGSRESLGVHLVTSVLSSKAADLVSGQSAEYQMSLRMRRTYKNYDVVLKDVERRDYAGSNTVRDFSSEVSIVPRDGGEALDGRIWMNNPMRFRGETFYQSSFTPSWKSPNGKDTTGLQVVKNAGWLIPYIACAFACLGMLSHFGTTFARFASRFDRERLTTPVVNSKNAAKGASTRSETQLNQPTVIQRIHQSAAQARRGLWGWLLPVLTLAFIGFMFGTHLFPERAKDGQVDWYAAGSLPVQHEGRIKPLDSVARNVLQALSQKTKTVVRSQEEDPKLDKVYTATEWFWGLISNQEWIDDAKVFRIDAKEVLDVFGLESHESGGSFGLRQKLFGQRNRNCYSWNQLAPKFDDFKQKVAPIIDRAQKSSESLKFLDQKFLELNEKSNIFFLIRAAYSTNQLPRMPKEDASEDELKQFEQAILMELQQAESIEAGHPPAFFPPSEKAVANREAGVDPSPWKSLRSILGMNIASRAFGIGEPVQTEALLALFDARESLDKTDATAFNKAIATFGKEIGKSSVAEKAMPKAAFEAWYNQFGAFNGCTAMYLIATILLFVSMMVAPQSFRRISFWIVVSVFVIHVFAILARIYITGRAPVINLYSSAVYIGCGAVLFGIVVEMLFPIRLGLIVGSLIGATTLLVANGLETSDTMPVLQAVLDTQFWLTTHVQAITAGYFATFVAGGMAIGAIIHRIFNQRILSSRDSDTEAHEIQRILYRVTYGALCFAIVFSLIGTVLGGLWADDSWGRFWGWDPKENGALMIVLWNAIVLHARWDRLVGERGFALLCIGGNIMTAWSWFGTNQLGIGLHSYGFTSSVLWVLTGFVASQLLLIVAGLVLTGNSSSKADRMRPAGSWD
jgi:ABC-type transport system involved in cytochrome c biogenesis permease subunit